MSKQYNATLQAYNAQLQALIDTANSLPEAGGSSRPSAKYNEVNFYDYDGTLLYSYTVEEAQALTELPPLPTQPGLVCQGWNYDLETIKSYNRAMDVGATYITDDGKTRLYIRIATEGRMTVPLVFSQTVSNGVVIDWGDNSTTETISYAGIKNVSHTYAATGEYVISLEAKQGTFILGNGNNGGVMGSNVSSSNNSPVYRNMLKKVELGANITNIENYTFYYCHSLANIVIPNSITKIGAYAFNNCNSLASIIIPNGVTNIDLLAFRRCGSLTNIIIPNSVTSIASQAFSNCASLGTITIPNNITNIGEQVFESCYSLEKIIIPNGVTHIERQTFSQCESLATIVFPNSITSIDTYAFGFCEGVILYDFTSHTTIPTLSDTSAFESIPPDCKIKVPEALYDEWITATNWSAYADKIVVIIPEDEGETDESGKGEIITFTINNIIYQAESGMTWAEWCDTQYNTLGLINDGYDIVLNPGEPSAKYIYDQDWNDGLSYSVIIPNYDYILSP